MISNKVKEIYKNELINRLKNLNFDIDAWEIDLSDIEGEGHGYLIKDQYFENISGVWIKHKKNNANFILWLDVAYLEGKPPYIFIEIMDSQDDSIWRNYQISKPKSPKDQIINAWGMKNYKILKEQEYFSQEKHMVLWNSQLKKPFNHEE